MTADIVVADHLASAHPQLHTDLVNFPHLLGLLRLQPLTCQLRQLSCLLRRFTNYNATSLAESDKHICDFFRLILSERDAKAAVRNRVAARTSVGVAEESIALAESHGALTV